MQTIALAWKGIQIFSTRLNEFGLGVTWLWLWEKVVRLWQGVSPVETTRVVDGLFVGGQHYKRGIELMKQMGIGATLNLREESDDVGRGVAFPLHLSLPAPDDGAPDMNQLSEGVAFIRQVIQSGQGVYIHCAQGVGRAPTMAAVYLISEGHKVESAMKLIRKVRPFITPTPMQMKCLNEWAKQMNNETMNKIQNFKLPIFNLQLPMTERLPTSPMKIEPMTLNGKWVRVEPLEERHAADLYVAGASPEIWTYMSRGRGVFTSVEDTAEWIRGAHKDAKELSQIPFAIINLEKGKAVGSTRYMDISRPDWRVEIGWTWLAVSEWRTPINTECKYLLLKHAFETLHCVRLQIKTDLRNVQSQKAIERLGAVKEGVLRQQMMRNDGYVRDTVMYSIIEAEWGEVKRRLEEKMSLGK